MPQSFQIESDQEDIVLRFKRDLVDPTTLSRLLNHIERTSLQSKSTLSPEQADEIADEIDAAVWEQVKDKYTT